MKEFNRLNNILSVAVYTLGCKLNQCESEGLADAFYHNGFTIVKPAERADIYIVNTCTVTSKAEQKARRMIRKFALSDHQPLVIVTGCYAQMEQELISRVADRLIIVPLERKAHLLSLPAYISIMLTSGRPLRESVEAFITDKQLLDREHGPFSYEAVTFMYHARAFLKIEDGCDNACSYCRVTLARGAAVSLPANQAVERALEIERRGYREIVLTGVNITAYRDGNIFLGSLIEKMLDSLSDRTRIRLSSLEPDMIDEKLIDLCRDQRIQPHFHIPLQSGSEKVLASVNRVYDMQEAMKAIEKLKSVKEDPFMAADVITGLPGEGEDDFNRSFELLTRLGFSQVHVFPYSPRPDTPLYDADSHVPEYLRDQRAQRLRELSVRLFEAYRNRWVSKSVEAIIEHHSGEDIRAVTGNYLKVKVVGLPPDVGDLRGRMCRGVLEHGEKPGDLTLRFTEFV
jgi:threonylcarbamoyladenosine tRNA methylthiotransferase MtaB